MKKNQYELAISQIKALTESEPDLIANLSNITAVLKSQFNFWWVGFYLVRGNELVLGPFQGPVACTRIGYGKGVCGKAWELKEIINVPDVHTFEGHIACSSESNSEIVIPICKSGEVAMILDIDSTHFNQFDHIDSEQLAHLGDHISTLL